MRKIICAAAVVLLLCAMLAFSGCNSGSTNTDTPKISEVVSQTSTKSNTTYGTIPNTGNNEYSPRY